MKRYEESYDFHVMREPAENGEQPEVAENMKRKRVVNRVKTTMLSRNINVLGHRTSIRLEKEMWEALKSIAAREYCSVHDICSLVSIRKREDTSLTAAIRVFLMLYFKAAATEEGHVFAGHGNFEQMKQRAGFNTKMKDLAEQMSSELDDEELGEEESADKIHIDQNMVYMDESDTKSAFNN